MKEMKKIISKYLLFLCFFGLTSQALDKKGFHTWTDVGGKKIQAQFVKLEGAILTIRLRGPQYNLKMADLNQESQNLFRYLTTPGNIAARTKRGDFHEWTNVQGKTIRAKLVKVLGNNLTIEMAGQEFPLKLSDLSEDSKSLAQNLAVDKPAGTEPPPANPLPSGIHRWTNKAGRRIEAEFVKLAGDVLTIKMSGKEFGLPLASLSDQSQALARQLSQPPEKPKADPKAEKEDKERIAHYLQMGGADKKEISETMEAAKQYFVNLAKKDEQGWFYPPQRTRKVVGYKEKVYRYKNVSKTVTRDIPIYEYRTEQKEVYRTQKVGTGSSAISVRKKVKVNVQVRGKQIGSKKHTHTYNQLVRDEKGSIERTHKIPQYGPGGPDIWKAYQWGHNALAVYALIKAGVEPTDDLVLIPLESLRRIYLSYGFPDQTWDLAWSVAAFAESEQEHLQELATMMASKLASGSVQEKPGLGLWGPVCIDIPLLGKSMETMISAGLDFAKFKKKFAEKKETFDERKMNAAEETIKQALVLKKKLTMMARETSVPLSRMALKDMGFSDTAGQTIHITTFPQYVWNQTSVDMESTMVALYGLSVAVEKKLLPEETLAPRSDFGRRAIAKPRKVSQVIMTAIQALVAKQEQDGAFGEANIHQPVNAFNKQDLLRGIPADPKTFKPLDSPTTIVSTAQGFASLNSFAKIAGTENFRRFAKNLDAARKILDRDLPEALFSSSPDLGESTFAPFDLIFSISDAGPQNPNAPVEFDSRLSRFLVEHQEKDGTWTTKHKPKRMITSSFRERFKSLPEVAGAKFDYSQAFVPPKSYLVHYYSYTPKLVPTAYSLIALSRAIKTAPIPEDIGEQPVATNSAVGEEKSGAQGTSVEKSNQ